MQEGMSDEDAIQKAESEYHGQVNLVEEQALKINKRQVAFQKALRQGCYPSEIVLAMVVDHLQARYASKSASVTSSSTAPITLSLFLGLGIMTINLGSSTAAWISSGESR